MFGYKSSEACIICGEHKDNESEPRFGYTVCEEHRNVSIEEVNNKINAE